MKQLDTLPLGSITMRQLLEHTGVMRETIRLKIRSKHVECLGILGKGRNKTSVYRQEDVQFIFETDFSGYKKVSADSRCKNTGASEYPF